MPASPIRALLDSKPSELWLIQVRKVGLAHELTGFAGELADLIERSEHQLLDQELRFVQTINKMLKRGYCSTTDTAPSRCIGSSWNTTWTIPPK